MLAKSILVAALFAGAASFTAEAYLTSSQTSVNDETTPIPTNGGDGDSSNSSDHCSPGVCTDQDPIMWLSSDRVQSEMDCKMACFNWQGKPLCSNYTYLDGGLCVLFKECPTVSVVSSVKNILPEFMPDTVPSQYKSCRLRYATRVVQGWIDLSDKETSQISEGWGGNHKRAIDGNARADWGGRSCTHTNGARNAWWKVDLGGTAKISEVKVTNRGDCCGHRLGNFNIFVDDNACAENQAVAQGQTEAKECVAEGRTVKIAQNSNHNYLTLCEVQVKAAVEMRTVV